MPKTKPKSTKRNARGERAPALHERNEKLARDIAKMTSSDKGKPAKQVYFDEKWVAARWGFSVKYLQKLRGQGGGPAFVKFGNAVRYRLREILRYERAQSRTSTSD